MKKISLLLIVSFCSIFAFGQNTGTSYFVNETRDASTGSRIDVNSKGDTILVSEYNTKNLEQNSARAFERYYKGTPYFANGWYQGKMVLKGGEPVEGLMAYDLVRGSVYFSKNAHSEAVELRPDEFTLKGYNFSKYTDEVDGAGNYFYQTLVNTEPLLLKHYTCNYNQTKMDVDNGYGSSKASEYEGEYKKSEKYYMVIDRQMILVTKKKSFFKSLGTYTEKAKLFADQERLNMKKAADVKALAIYLGTL